MRTIGYARVSSVEQALGTSLQDQQEVIRAHARKSGLTVDRMYVEAESAVHEKAERREQVQALMADLRQGDLVLVDKIDRWSRDPEFSYRTIRTILATGARFVAIGDDCDPSTPHGDSMLGLRVFFAREEHKRIKLRMVGTRKLLRDRGYYADGIVPWGYKRQDVRGPERNALLVDEVAAQHVRRAFGLCAAGRSLREVGETIDRPKDQVAKMLRNRVYLGEVKDASGSWIKARHVAIVDAALFLKVRDSLERRRLGERKSHDDSETASWWLRELARCALCGSKMAAAYAGPHEKRRHYYRCFKRCTSSYVPVRPVESDAAPLVLARLVELRAELATLPASAPPRHDAASLEQKRERLQRKRARYVEAFADGAMTRDDLREAIAHLDEQRTKLDALAQEPPPVAPGQRRATLSLVSQMRRAWRAATPTERRAIAHTLARSVALEAGGAPVFTWYDAEELAGAR